MHQTRVVSKLIWHKEVPLKVSIFAWRMPTKDNLGKHGVLLDEGSLCVFGCGGVKSVHHLFLNYNIFGFLWY